MQGKSETKSIDLLNDKGPGAKELIRLITREELSKFWYMFVKSSFPKVNPSDKITFAKPGDIDYDSDRAADKILAALAKVHRALQELHRGLHRTDLQAYDHMTDEGEDKIYTALLEELGVWDDGGLFEALFWEIGSKKQPNAEPNVAASLLVWSIKTAYDQGGERAHSIWKIIGDFMSEQGVPVETKRAAIEKRYKDFCRHMQELRGAPTRKGHISLMLRVFDTLDRDKRPEFFKRNIPPAVFREHLTRLNKKR